MINDMRNVYLSEYTIFLYPECDIFAIHSQFQNSKSPSDIHVIKFPDFISRSMTHVLILFDILFSFTGGV